jgi:hypothetical protein
MGQPAAAKLYNTILAVTDEVDGVHVAVLRQ